MWSIVIPTIRDPRLTAPVFARLFESLTRPTDVHILDGSAGKSVTLNDGLTLFPGTADYYATIDDDIVLPRGWQDAVEAAFADNPRLGAVGIDYSNTAEGRAYMMEVQPEQVRDGYVLRPLETCNVAGGCIIMRSLVAGMVGEYPHRCETVYEYDEDGWRCMRVRNMGLTLGYVRPLDGYASIVPMPDDPEYLARKQRDTEALRANPIDWTGGPTEPQGARLFKFTGTVEEVGGK